MAKKNINSADKKHLWHPYTDIDASEAAGFPVIKKGKGSYFYDSDGKKYLDGIASWWCVNLGHGRKELISAINTQAKKLQHVILGGLTHESAALLSEKLAQIAPAGLTRSFFCGDGASAVEASMRMALQYWTNKGVKNRTKLISLKDGYHGDTLGAVGVGYIEKFHKPIKAALAKNYTADSPHCAKCIYKKTPDECSAECFASMEKIAKAHYKQTAAVIIEPLCQGAAGVRIYSSLYLKKLRKLCDELGLLLIADEIAVGFARTGSMFACEKAGISPDIMTLGKGMTAGYLPMSAVMAKEKIYDAFRRGKTFYYGHTFSGNPITAAAAVAALGVYEKEKIPKSLAQSITLMKQEMNETAELFSGAYHDSLGMISMIEIPENEDGSRRADKAAQAARSMGLFIRPLGNVLYLWPPLTSSKKELNAMFEILRDAIVKTA